MGQPERQEGVRGDVEVVRVTKTDINTKSQAHLLSCGTIRSSLPQQCHGRASPQEAATLPPEAGPWGGKVMGGRNRAFSFPDRLAISGSWAS